MNGTGARRIKVVGNTGAGKTTFARALAARLGVPHLELDAAFWGPGWQLVDEADGQATVRRFVSAPDAADGWVVDGNWNRRIGDALPVELVVWLDYPRRVVMPRVIRRTLGRVVLRRELWHGNRERWRSLLRREPEENIVRWAWTEHDAYRDRYLDLMAQGTVPVLRLTSPRAARRWLADPH
ncbi:toxin [Cellulomonas soli]|uniref:toxin n=1 Tax=Cellulomonas soli TaxID=931535 RepID=UPI003F84B823